MVTHLQNFNSTSKTGSLTLINGFKPGDSDRQSREKPSAHTYLDNRGLTAQRDSKRQQPSHFERLEKKEKTKSKLIFLLNKIGESELVERLKVCHTRFAALSCGSHIISRKPLHTCEFRLCPFCAARRSRKIQRKYLPMATAFLKFGQKLCPVHLVLTQAHRTGEKLADGRKRLMASFKKLQRREFWQRSFAGGTYSFEATIGKDGSYHCHLHILGFRRRFFDISLLRREWFEVTGDSHVLRLEKIGDLKTGLREIVKYISKPLDIEKFRSKHIREFLTLKRARMFGAFGEFAKFCRIDYQTSDNVEKIGFCEGDACPVCEMPLFELFLSANELIAFEKRLELSKVLRL